MLNLKKLINWVLNIADGRLVIGSRYNGPMLATLDHYKMSISSSPKGQPSKLNYVFIVLIWTTFWQKKISKINSKP